MDFAVPIVDSFGGLHLAAAAESPLALVQHNHDKWKRVSNGREGLTHSAKSSVRKGLENCISRKNFFAKSKDKIMKS